MAAIDEQPPRWATQSSARPVHPGPRRPLTPEAAHAQLASFHVRAAVLVEGWSDQEAVETLAHRFGFDLDLLNVAVLPIGGATNAPAFIGRLGPAGLGLRLAALYDLAEERHFLQTLTGASATLSDRRNLAEHGFFACRNDLEEEMIRAMGVFKVLEVVVAEGELAGFRRFQAQPFQQGRPLEAQLHRFLGTRAGRKIRYGRRLAEALDLAHLPLPLVGLLGWLANLRSV